MAVYIRARLKKASIDLSRFTQVAVNVLSAAGEAQSELSIDLVGDRRMRGLNRKYRQKDRTTDVLAFAMREAEKPVGSPQLGDVVISVPTARRQAREAGHSLDEEVAALLIHGVLHLCGYDHERSEKEAKRMKRREHGILNKVRPMLQPLAVTARRRTGSH